MRFPVPALGFLILLAAGPQSAERIVVLSGEGRVSGESWTLERRGVQVVSSTLRRTIESPVLLESVSVSPTQERRAEGVAAVHLSNGEILHGKILPSDAPGTVLVETLSFGTQRIGLDSVNAIQAGAGRMGASIFRPGLVLINGDVIPGAVKAVDPGSAAVDSDFGEVRTDMDRITTVVVKAEPPQVDARGASQWLCRLADGRRWYLDGMTQGSAAHLVKVERGGKSAEIAVNQIRRLVFRDWALRSLTALDAPKVSTTPYFDGPVSVQIDDEGNRRPRMLGGRVFLGGMTAEPLSRVTYALKGPASYLLGWVGMDPVRGSRGQSEVRVEGQDRVLLSIRDLGVSSGARRIVVPISGVDDLTLVTDFGERGALGDCVNWCELLLVVRNR